MSPSVPLNDVIEVILKLKAPSRRAKNAVITALVLKFQAKRPVADKQG